MRPKAALRRRLSWNRGCRPADSGPPDPVGVWAYRSVLLATPHHSVPSGQRATVCVTVIQGPLPDNLRETPVMPTWGPAALCLEPGAAAFLSLVLQLDYCTSSNKHK